MNDKDISIELKALYCIETIAEDAERASHEEKQEAISTIFKLAHAGRSPSCNKAHPDWVTDIEDLYAKFKSQ